MVSIAWLSVAVSLLAAEKIVCQSPTLEAQVNELVNAGMATREIPGVSLAVVHNRQVVLTKGYGVKDAVTKLPVDADTVYGIASLSKGITTAVLAKTLRTNSTYDLSTNINTILGQDAAKLNNTQLTTYATLTDLMTHAMGIPSNNFMRLDTDLTRKNLMECWVFSLFLKLLTFTVVTSRTGKLTYVAWVIAGLDKQWEDIVTTELFQPLGMANSTFITRVNFSSSNVATPYSADKTKRATATDTEFLRTYSGIGGSGAVMSTANDMAKYLLFLVSGGKNQAGQQVLEAADLKTAFTPLAALPSTSQQYPITKPITPVTMSTDTYGLGWRLGYYRGYKMIQHTGTTFGYESIITMLPHSGSAIYTALSGIDSGYSFRASLHCAILDILLHKKAWINATTISTFPSPWVGAARKKRNALRVVNNESILGYTPNRLYEEEGDIWTSQRTRDSISHSNNKRSRRDNANILEIPLTNFTGYYCHGAYGKVNITLDSAGNKLKMFYGKGLWELNHTGNGLEFNADWLGKVPSYYIRLKFLANENVYGFECLDCDRNYVPAFYRH